MTRSEIFFNYLHTIRKATELQRIARDIRRLEGDKAESNIIFIQKNWSGDASNSYVKKYRQIIYKMNVSAISLEASAETIKKIALRTYKSEMETLELAKNRTYGH